MVLSAHRTALWVIPVANLGGVARHVLDVASVGIPGWRLVFLCPEGPLVGELRARGAAVLVSPFGPDAGLTTSLRSLRRAVRKLRPNIVHTHLAYADIAAAISLVGLPTQLVSTEHGIAPADAVYHGARWKSWLMARVHSLRILAFARVIAVCQSTKDVMEAKWKPRRPIDVVYNGVERREEMPPRSEGPLRVASIARLAPEKRIGTLLDAFALVVAEQPDARLTIAGDGPLREELIEKAARLGLGEHVAFPGHVDARQLMERTDVLVQLSVWENCSYSILDACAAGLGVVATPVGGNPEILSTANLVDAEAPASVAASITDQAVDLSTRPVLSPDWPTVRGMANAISRSYGTVGR